MKNFKFIYSNMLVVLVFALMITSCAKEDIRVDNENTAEQLLNEEIAQSSDLRTIRVLLPENIIAQGEEKVKSFIRQATPKDIKEYQKNAIIIDFLYEAKEVSKEMIEEWKNKSLLDLDLSIYLDKDQIKELHQKLLKSEEEEQTVTSRGGCYSTTDCSWARIHVVPIHYPSGHVYYLETYKYSCTTNTVVLWEGNNATQDIVGELDLNSDRCTNFTQDDCFQNDEARSAELWNMKAGQRISIYDDSNGNNNNNDDYMIIDILQDIEYVLIKTFEEDINNSHVHAEYCCGGNLDGKVSLICTN